MALATGCASDRQPQLQASAAIERTTERRDACYADAALALDDGVSDARAIGQAVAARCRQYTEEADRRRADDVATAYVREFRRLRKLPG